MDNVCRDNKFQGGGWGVAWAAIIWTIWRCRNENYFWGKTSGQGTIMAILYVHTMDEAQSISKGLPVLLSTVAGESWELFDTIIIANHDVWCRCSSYVVILCDAIGFFIRICIFPYTITSICIRKDATNPLWEVVLCLRKYICLVWGCLTCLRGATSTWQLDAWIVSGFYFVALLVQTLLYYI